MTEPEAAKVEALAAAIAKRGEDWPSARQRAKWLLQAVRVCAPCPYCDPEDLARYGFAQGWSEDAERDEACQACRYRLDEPGEFYIEPPPPPRAIPPLAPGDRPCKGCGAPAVPFGAFCAACYGDWLHPEGEPMEPGDPDDPFRAFNAEADAYQLDQQMPDHMRNPRPRPLKPPMQRLPPFDDDLPFTMAPPSDD